MQDLKEKYSKLIQLVSTASDTYVRPLKIYHDTPYGKVYLDNPDLQEILKKKAEDWEKIKTMLPQVFKTHGMWQKIPSFTQSNPHAPLYRGVFNQYLTYQQCHDITEAFSDFDKAPQRNYSPYLILQKAETALRTLAPVDRYYKQIESTSELGLELTLTIDADYFPTLAAQPELIVNTDALGKIANAHSSGLALIDDIHHGLSPSTSRLLQEPNWARAAEPKVL